MWRHKIDQAYPLLNPKPRLKVWVGLGTRLDASTSWHSSGENSNPTKTTRLEVSFALHPPSTIHTLLKMGSYSSTTMCQYWDNHLIYWAVYWLFYWHVPIVTHCCATVTITVHVYRIQFQGQEEYVGNAAAAFDSSVQLYLGHIKNLHIDLYRGFQEGWS